MLLAAKKTPKTLSAFRKQVFKAKVTQKIQEGDETKNVGWSQTENLTKLWTLDCIL